MVECLVFRCIHNAERPDRNDIESLKCRSKQDSHQTLFCRSDMQQNVQYSPNAYIAILIEPTFGSIRCCDVVWRPTMEGMVRPIRLHLVRIQGAGTQNVVIGEIWL